MKFAYFTVTIILYILLIQYKRIIITLGKRKNIKSLIAISSAIFSLRKYLRIRRNLMLYDVHYIIIILSIIGANQDPMMYSYENFTIA